MMHFFGYGEAEDYTVNVVAGCEAPVSVSVSAITGTSATVNWNQSGSPYGWVVLYGEAGFDPETDGMSAFTASKPYIIDDLALATAYDVYVRAICSDEDVSDWSSIADFSTLCIVPSILSTKDSSNCGAASITLEATASDGAIIKWYASLSDYEPVAIGNVFIAG